MNGIYELRIGQAIGIWQSNGLELKAGRVIGLPRDGTVECQTTGYPYFLEHGLRGDPMLFSNERVIATDVIALEDLIKAANSQVTSFWAFEGHTGATMLVGEPVDAQSAEARCIRREDMVNPATDSFGIQRAVQRDRRVALADVIQVLERSHA